jgi:hypothetical protein
MRYKFAQRLLPFGPKQHEFVEMLDDPAPSLCELGHARREFGPSHRELVEHGKKFGQRQSECAASWHEFAAMLSEFADYRSVDRARRCECVEVRSLFEETLCEFVEVRSVDRATRCELPPHRSMKRPMRDMSAPMLHELLATLSSFRAMRYEFRPTRSVLFARPRPRGGRIREQFRARRPLGGLQSKLRREADE